MTTYLDDRLARVDCMRESLRTDLVVDALHVQARHFEGAKVVGFVNAFKLQLPSMPGTKPGELMTKIMHVPEGIPGRVRQMIT